MTSATIDAPRALFRASFNFADKCNLGCKFCYIPFSRSPVREKEVRRVLERLIGLGVRTITIGGGDPLMYGFIPDVVSDIRPSLSFLQLDSNLVTLTKQVVDAISPFVDVLGVPLDGSRSSVHDYMRSAPGHFDTVLDALSLLGSAIPLKVNTVLSGVNQDDLPHLAMLVGDLNPRLWSIYQFWPIGARASRFAKRFTLSADSYTALVNALLLNFPSLPIEPGLISDRNDSYFFVTHSGDAYCVSDFDPNTYHFLGSVFDDDILQKWVTKSSAHKQPTRILQRINAVNSGYINSPLSRRYDAKA